MVAPLLALLLFGSSNPDPYPKDYFRSPLGIPLVLAGSFAEMRANHFHSGLDIKTNGSSGYRVYASADGWVVRISVAPGGFGNALYVEHPNGYMTVYAHLDRFSPELAEYITTLQYAREEFAVDAFPKKGQYPVSKGDVIAFSGNSGSSSGPHLHFEIRNVKNGWPENPMLFGLDIPDTLPPRIRRIKLYTMDAQSQLRIRDSRTGGWRTVTGDDDVLLDVTLSNGAYRFTRADQIEARGRIGFGIQTADYHDGSNNQLGAYEIDLTVNGTSIYASKMESFSFSQTRYVNAHVDYGEYIRNRRWIQRSYLLPGNSLPFYHTIERGILRVDAGQAHRVEYRIADPYGNEAILPFELLGVPDEDVEPLPDGPAFRSDLVVAFDQPMTFTRPGFSVRMPAHTLYDNTILSYRLLDTHPKGSIGPVHRFHDNATPVQEAYTVSLDADAVNTALRSKASLAMVSENGRLSYAGGTFQNGRITGTVRSFGDFTIASDTLAPSIRPINISNGKKMTGSGNIRFRIADNFSGIKDFRGSVDGKWVLFTYDAKSGMLRHSFDGRVKPGSHQLRLLVQDQLGNVETYEAQFTL